jgi:hypothetical protein
MCVHGFISFFIDLPFFAFSLCLCSFSFTFLFEHVFFFQVIEMLSIISLTTLPFQKVCGSCHVVNAIISPTGDVHCNACRLNSTVQKLSFLHGSIATSGELVQLCI